MNYLISQSKADRICHIFFVAILFSLNVVTTSFAKDLKLQDLNKPNQNFQHSLGDDLLSTGKFMTSGSIKQFSTTSNLIMWGVTAVTIGYFIHNDERISQKAVINRENEKFLNIISDSAIVFNTPLVPALFYSIARYREDEKMLRFTQEYTATLGIALIESLFISAVPVHQRPDEKSLSFWEEAFRGKSSFPSGHVIGFSALGFKAFQFYGPIAAAPPLLLAGLTAFQRVHSEKHYASDVIASGLMTFMASEGVRIASGYDKNHPLYQWIFEHNFNIGFFKQNNLMGVMMTFGY